MNSKVVLLARNSAANLLRAAAASIVGIVLPIILVRGFSPSLYSAWVLVFSLASYVLFFDVGMPATVQSLVARAAASGDRGGARRAAMSGISVTGLIAGIFLILAGIGSNAIAIIGPGMPPDVRPHAGVALLIISVGQACSLLSNTAAAYFAGLQRSIIPAGVVAPARVLSLVACGLAAVFTQSLEIAAICFAVPNLVGCVILITLIRVETREAGPAEHPRVNSIVGLLKYAGPMILWSATMLASTGLGVTIVARFAYHDLVAYSMAQVVYTGIFGLVSAIGAPLLPEFAHTSVRDPQSLSSRLISSTAIHSALLTALAGACLTATPFFLWLAMGASGRSPNAWATTIALVWAAVVHLSLAPLSMAFIASGRHYRFILPPVLQAAATVLVSLVLAPLLGSVGVALGSAVGSLVGFAFACYGSVRRLAVTSLTSRVLAERALYLPAIGLVAATALTAIVCVVFPAPAPWGVILSLAAAVITVVWEWRVLPADFRDRLVHFAGVFSRN